MTLQKPQRSNAPMKILISGPSGSGKTFSALQLARGLTEKWEDICLIDSEFGSASFYSNLGAFNVIQLDPPYHPNRFVEAVKLAIDAGMKTIVIDSISHEWSGKGGCLELHEQATQKMKVPNSFTAWSAVTPLHQQFLDTIIQSPVHVIGTSRSRTEYVLVDRNGKQVPQKVGMSPVMRDGTEYEFSVHFELDQMHRAHCSKDRTQLFQDTDPFMIDQKTGELILGYLFDNTDDSIALRIQQCLTMRDLKTFYGLIPVETQDRVKHLFRKRKAELMASKINSEVVQKHSIMQNGLVEVQ